MKSPMKATRTVLPLRECSVMLIPSFTSSANRLGPGGSRERCFSGVQKEDSGHKTQATQWGIVLAPDTALSVAQLDTLGMQ